MLLVTGATGHVGNTLVRALAEQGAELRLFLPPQESVQSLDGIKFDLVCGDITRPADVRRAVEGCEAVYHLAGLIDISPKDADQLEAVNVRGTQNMVEACLACGVKRLVYISSVHALPEPPKGTTLREMGASAFPNPHLKGAYAISKSKATAAIYDGINRGLDAVIVFPSGVIGPSDYRGSQMGKVMQHLLQKKARIFSYFKGAYNFVDVRDVATALQLAMERGTAGEGYIISGHTITLGQLFRFIATWTGKTTVKLVCFPLWLVKLAAHVVTSFAHLFNRKPYLTPYSIDVLNSNAEMDNAKARRELGFIPRPIEETMASTLEWLQHHSPKMRHRRKK